MQIKRPSGMPAFIYFWMGQVVSLLGSAMTWFAFTLWVWQQTGKASSLAMVSFLSFLPSVIFMPIAGIYIDRWERKNTLIISDLANACATLIVLLLYLTDHLALWHIYSLSFIAGVFTAFQYPAYMATVSTLVPFKDITRALGMVDIARMSSSVFAPMLAAVLLPRIGMTGIMTIDLLTFLFAFAVLMWIKITPRSDTQPLPKTLRGFMRDIAFGFKTIFAAPRLKALTILFILTNFFLAIGATLLSPTVLSHTGNNVNALASIMTVGAVGGIVGGSILSIWGGPKQREMGILIGGVCACLMGISLFGLARSVLVWSVASFFFSFFEPFVEGGNTAIWQTTVHINSQGRVLSARQLLTQIPYLIGVAASGWIAEAGIAKFTGTQNGLHLSVTLLLAGIFGAVIFLAGSFHPVVRQTE